MVQLSHPSKIQLILLNVVSSEMAYTSKTENPQPMMIAGFTSIHLRLTRPIDANRVAQ